MGGGTYTACSFRDYSTSMGRSVSATGRVSGHQYSATNLKRAMDPKNKIRECCNTDEHPNTVPVILGLDVTGSMGKACDEVAATLSQIVGSLYNQFKDIEIMIMGIGDFEVGDQYPLQVSQFESDVRIAKQLDQLYIERGGGSNEWESYTAAWWFGLYRTKLDCFDKQHYKGIIITMGDEPLNPSLPPDMLDYVGFATDDKKTQYVFNTKELYEKARAKFDIFHISVDDHESSYKGNDYCIDASFKYILGNNYKVSTINDLKDTICSCISQSISSRSSISQDNPSFFEPITGDIKRDEDGGIVW